ncbi:aspartate/glutamate racemase family protein [Phenylobacterium sp.]|uniref:aspartate/glutamate racemase family protein n=1 Tax=Phenylobacterium sp. TaxID=1871053 RepID=UPI0035652EF5
MKTLGLLGGMSAESTTVYYQVLNRLVRERLGGLHSADLILRSVDFAPIADLQAKDDWDATGTILADAARRLETAGAQAILICANTMHLNYDQVAAAVSAPVIHIADATARALEALGVRRPLLLATRFTMEKAFYRDRLAAQGIEATIPAKTDRDRLHAIIFEELVVGDIRAASKAETLAIYAKARAEGCDGVIFGCTEIGLLVSPDDFDTPAVDTAIAHCEAAVDFALG